MSCYSCASKFGMFNKEHGCKQCGFSFCSKCLQNKTSVPKRNNETHHVCSKCFDVLTGKVNPKDLVPARVSPPKALLSMIADNANKQSPVNTRKKQHTDERSKSSRDVLSNTKGMSPADIEIAQRLNRLRQKSMHEEPPPPSQKEIEQRLSALKAKDDPPPSREELERRLAVLKGLNPDEYKNRTQFSPLNQHKTEFEETQDLLDEIMDEVRIDSRASGASGLDDGSSVEPSKFLKDSQPAETGKPNDQDLSNKSLDDIQNLMENAANEVKEDADKAIRGLQKDKELWDRVNKLKEERKKRSEEHKTPNQEEGGSSGEDDEAEVNRVIEEISARKDLSDSDMDAESEEKRREKLKDQEEFPWCCICNEDATLRCADCDDDLYCAQCFREGHDNFDLKSHRVFDFKKT